MNYPDTIQVAARISRIGRSSMTMEHVIFSQSQQAVVGEADSTMVSFDYATGKSQPVPEEARAEAGPPGTRPVSTTETEFLRDTLLARAAATAEASARQSPRR